MQNQEPNAEAPAPEAKKKGGAPRGNESARRYGRPKPKAGAAPVAPNAANEPKEAWWGRRKTCPPRDELVTCFCAGVPDGEPCGVELVGKAHEEWGLHHGLMTVRRHDGRPYCLGCYQKVAHRRVRCGHCHAVIPEADAGPTPDYDPVCDKCFIREEMLLGGRGADFQDRAYNRQDRHFPRRGEIEGAAEQAIDQLDDALDDCNTEAA